MSLAILVENLPETYTEELLRLLFDLYGTVTHCVVFRDVASGKPKGGGIVRFSTHEEASNAMNSLNGMILEGGRLPLQIQWPGTAEAAAPSAPGPIRTAAPTYRSSPYSMAVPSFVPQGDLTARNVFIGSLPPTFTEVELHELLKACPTPSSVLFLRDRITGRSKNSALVSFANTADGDETIRRLNGYVPPGSPRPIDAKWAEGREQKNARLAARVGMQPQAQAQAQWSAPPDTQSAASYATILNLPEPEIHSNLYLWGLPAAVDDLYLYRTFAHFGAIQSVKSFAHKGYGFVRYYRQKDAALALSRLDGAEIAGQVMHVSLHVPKSGVDGLEG
eukprot:TRINITY_DN42999_c0_g1_i1.p1 TRINITY_DN42999_c0_g1~~TRINITY_DN42999_c0_g1_i1.p1  ORF type:complete len:341 (+),score=37.95 TRINITY_DN42999_c0_g1_i1:24-1025(+)